LYIGSSVCKSAGASAAAAAENVVAIGYTATSVV